MHITLITPARPTDRSGNHNTAFRWARMLRKLGHKVNVQETWDGKAADMLLALHARRSHASIKAFAECFPQHPLVVTLTGTDLYRDIRTDKNAQESLRLATLLIVLQDMGIEELPPEFRAKTRSVYQSAPAMQPGKPSQSHFDICVVGHLRDEKDPFRTAFALRHLPETSHIRVIHMGGAIEPEMEAQARQHATSDARYRWLGELPRWQVRKMLARCRLMILSSRMEGGANVIAEALSAGIPVIASKVSGNIGMLGKDYLGYFTLEDEKDLASILSRTESDAAFYAKLKRQCTERARLMAPAKEMAALNKVIEQAAKLAVPH